MTAPEWWRGFRGTQAKYNPEEVVKRLLLVFASLALGGLTQVAHAQDRNIKGRVTSAQQNLGISDATVSLGAITVRTDAEGDFLIPSAPAGEVSLLVRAIGYQRRDVTVPADENEVQIALEQDILRLDEIVVTGQATGIERRNLANAVATVSAAQLDQVPTPSVEQQLQGKVAGADIQTNSGAPGGGVQVRLRGVTSINAAAEPLYVIDGVVVSDVAIPSNQNAVTNAAGGSNPDVEQDGQVNRIADLNPADIESLEILKGASAAAIYGQRASNGVVIITTKRGEPGETRFNFSQRFGTFSLSNKFGSRTFETVEEVVGAFGEGAAAQFQPGVVFDHEQQLAGRNGLSYETAASLSGGDKNTTYFASGLVKNDQGIIDNTGFERQSFRVNLDQRFGERISASLSTNLLHTLAGRGLTNNDNTGTSYYVVLPFTPNFVDIGRNDDGTFPDNVFISSNPLQTAALSKNDEDVWRIIGAGSVSLEPIRSRSSSLRVIASGGVDYFNQENSLFFPPELQFEPQDGEPGTALRSNSDNINANINGNLIHRYSRPGAGFSATTSVGIQHSQRSLNIGRIVSRNLVGGENVDAGTNVQVEQTRQRIRDLGFFAQEEFLTLNERLLLTAGIRADQSSLNSRAKRLFFYPKAAASFRFPGLGRIDELKLRAAYGESGNQPLYGQKFTPLTSANNIEGLPALTTLGTTGALDLRPERQREIEAGVDAQLFGSRASVELTAYQKSVSDLLLQRELAQSSGFDLAIFNGGKLRTRGVEVALGLVPAAGNFTWTSRTTFSLDRSKITELPVPAFATGGFGVSLGSFQIEEGASATQIVGNVLQPDGTRLVQKIGDANPDFRMAFSNDFNYRAFNLHFLLDWQQGADIINLTKFLYDLGQTTPDFDTPKPGDTLTVGPARVRDRGAGNTAVYLEDASFLKLREVTLSYNLPASFAQGLFRGRSASLSVSARNLFTATGYSGLDPEVSNFGNQPIARNIDVAPFPPSRSFWFGIELGF